MSDRLISEALEETKDEKGPRINRRDDLEFVELGVWNWGLTAATALLTVVVIVEDKTEPY